MKMENRSHIYDINRPKPRYSKYRKCLYVSTFEAQFLKKLSNTEAELKKSVAYKRSVYL